MLQRFIKKRFVSNSGLLLGSNIGVAGMAFIQSVVMARYLHAEGYGIFALLFSYVQGLLIFIDFKTPEAVIRYLAKYEKDGRADKSATFILFSLYLAFATSLLAALIAILVAPWVFVKAGHPDISVLVPLVSISIVVASGNQIYVAVMRYYDEFLKYALAQLLNSVLMLGSVFMVVVLFPNGGVNEIVMASLVGSAMGAVCLFCFYVVTRRGHLAYSVKRAPVSDFAEERAEVVRFLFHTNLGSAWSSVYRKFDVFVFGLFIGASELGCYKLAKNIIQSVNLVFDSFYSTIYPDVVKKWISLNPQEFSAYVMGITKNMAYIFIPLGLFVSIVAFPIIPIAFGESFRPAIFATQVLVWGTVLAGLIIWMRPWIIACGHPEVTNYSYAISAIVFISAVVLFSKHTGLVGAAVISFLAPFSGYLVVLYYLHEAVAIRSPGLKG